MTYVLPQGWFMVICYLTYIFSQQFIIQNCVNQMTKSLPEKQRQNWTSLIRYPLLQLYQPAAALIQSSYAIC